MSIHKLTLFELQKRFTAGEITASEIVRAYFLRIGQTEPKVKAYVTQTKEGAVAQARALDDALKGWRKTLPMMGMPLAIKDNICTEGVLTTCASRMLGNFVPPYDATVIRRLREQGYLLLGKTNLDEFAMGSSTENSAFGPSRNPWNLHCVPGGSSGGSAAAVAADECAAALGSDTGGSIRQPAAFCGVVGLKPTYGRVSRYGLIAFASSLDHIGPLTKTVKDAAIMLHTIAGRDPMDSTSADLPVPDYLAELDKPVKGLKIGVAREYFGAGLESETRNAVEAGIQKLAKMGCEVIEVSLPHTKFAIPAYYLVATAEASSNLARFDGVRYGYRATNARSLSDMYRRTRNQGFGAEVKRRIMLGTYALSAGYYDAYYLKAQRARTLLTRDFDEAFKIADVIVGPTSPTPAFKLGEKVDDPLAMYLADIYTVTANLAGIPGISVPVGKSKENLPIGMQIFGKHFDESTILRVAHAYEKAA